MAEHKKNARPSTHDKHTNRQAKPAKRNETPSVKAAREKSEAKIAAKKEKRSKGLCFITTAVCQTLGKPDNCIELETIRSFRDNWLAKTPNGKQIIDEYYEIAPHIVSSINKQPDSQLIFQEIWENHLELFFQQISDSKMDTAKETYLSMVTYLSNKYES
jgi:hypothetical protein